MRVEIKYMEEIGKQAILMSKKNIKNPLSKNAYKTFLGQFIDIHFFNDPKEEATSLESLKNMLFPSDLPDEEFNDLIEFIKIVMEDIIINAKQVSKISEELSEQVKKK